MRIFVSELLESDPHYLQKLRTPEERRAERRRIAEAKGKTYRTRKQWAGEVQERKARQRAIADAKKAWRYWLEEKCPDWWAHAYWAATGRPWNNSRLTHTEQRRLRYNVDPAFQLKERMRRQVNKAKKRDGIAEIIRGAIRKGGISNTVERELGYTIADLVQHLERQFTKNMDWAAFTAGKIHIDHIMPQASFDLQDDVEWRACWAMSNLQPLWAKDNLTKRDKVLSLC